MWFFNRVNKLEGWSNILSLRFVTPLLAGDYYCFGTHVKTRKYLVSVAKLKVLS